MIIYSSPLTSSPPQSHDTSPTPQRTWCSWVQCRPLTFPGGVVVPDDLLWHPRCALRLWGWEDSGVVLRGRPRRELMYRGGPMKWTGTATILRKRVRWVNSKAWKLPDTIKYQYWRYILIVGIRKHCDCFTFILTVQELLSSLRLCNAKWQSWFLNSVRSYSLPITMSTLGSELRSHVSKHCAHDWPIQVNERKISNILC